MPTNCTKTIAIDLDRASRLSTVGAAFANLRRLRIYSVRWDNGYAPVRCIYLEAGFKAISLGTDSFGDGLYLIDSDEVSIHPLLSPRDFSLHRYDLLTTDGRRKAREYVRRKLSKLRLGAGTQQ
jgi:hypothetical protein